VPTLAHSGPDTSHSGRTQRAGPSSSAAAAFVLVPAAVVALRNELQQASATPVPELDVVAALHSASVLEAVFEPGPETGPGAAAGSAVAVGVTAVGLEAAAGFGADSEFEFVPAEVEPLPVEAVPGDSTMASDCPAPDMAASTPSGVAVVGPVVLVVTEAVLGVEAGIALPHKRYFDLDLRVGQDAVVYNQPWHLGTRHIPSGRMRLCSTHRLAAGRLVDHNQGLAVREHATQGAGTQTAVVGKADAVVHRLSKFQHQQIETKGEKGHYIHYDVQGSLPSSGQILCALSQSSHSSTPGQLQIRKWNS
jgi:hypothetical protein